MSDSTVIDLTSDDPKPNVHFELSGYYGEEFRRMLKRVLLRCETEECKGTQIVPSSAFIGRAGMFTGLHEDVVKALFAGENIPLEPTIVERSVIQNELALMYLLVKRVPTTRQLFHRLHGKIPAHIDIGTFRKILIKMGYIWKRVKNNLVLMERPSVTFERIQYLKKIIHYREKRQPIYFIDENYFDAEGNFMQFNFTPPNITEGQRGVIYAISRSGVHATKCFAEFTEKQFQDWVSDDLLPLLGFPSIVVLRNASHHNKQIICPPTSDSVKIDMIEWLNYHNVVCNKQMSKVKLWSLIEGYTDPKDNMYIVDKILKANGHTVLRVPKCIDELTIASLVFELIKTNLETSVTGKPDEKLKHYESELSIIVNSIQKSHLLKYDDFIAAHEKQVYENDIAVDGVLDSVLMNTIPVNSYDYDSDLPSFSDSD